MHTRSYRHLSADERESVSLGLAHDLSIRAMAQLLGQAPSTVSRELSPSTTRGHPYRACTAQTQAAARACQPRRLRKLADAWLWRYVRRHLMTGCSPEQIAGRLRRAYPGNMRKQLSAETIYAALYVLPRGALRMELLAALRQARKTRRPRTRGSDRRGQIPNMTPITERPAEVATRMVILARMDGTDATSARRGFTTKLRHLPALLRKTRTYDRGKEIAEHEQLAHRLSIQVFFADPHSPWQRGTNENTNGLLRQYLPKGTDLSAYTQRELNAIAHRRNTRPRKCLGFAMPLEVYAQLRHHSPVALGT